MTGRDPYEAWMLERAERESRARDWVEPREVTMANRAMVAGIASTLIEEGDAVKGDALLNAVRCCNEFPECAHILDWIDA